MMLPQTAGVKKFPYHLLCIGFAMPEMRDSYAQTVQS